MQQHPFVGEIKSRINTRTSDISLMTQHVGMYIKHWTSISLKKIISLLHTCRVQPPRTVEIKAPGQKAYQYVCRGNTRCCTQLTPELGVARNVKSSHPRAISVGSTRVVHHLLLQGVHSFTLVRKRRSYRWGIGTTVVVPLLFCFIAAPQNVRYAISFDHLSLMTVSDDDHVADKMKRLP